MVFTNAFTVTTKTQKLEWNKCARKIWHAQLIYLCKIQGDSGGPLMAWQDGKLVQAGITSFIFNIPGLSHAFPSIFTRVNRYVDWIDETMSNN